MPEITAAAVKDLREKTGLPMMDCKQALTESGGDQEKAVEWLRKKGKKVQETAVEPFDFDRPDRGLYRSCNRRRRNRRYPLRVGSRGQQRALHRPGQRLGEAACHRSRSRTPDAFFDQPSPSQKGTLARSSSTT